MLKLNNSIQKIILFLVCIICIKSGFAENSNNKKGTVFIDNSIIVYAPLSDRKRNELKKRLGGGFYDAADDANFYIANADEFLSNNKIKNITISDQVKIINFSKKYFIKVDKIPAWTYIFYKNGIPPIFVNPIDVEKKYKSFYR